MKINVPSEHMTLGSLVKNPKYFNTWWVLKSDDEYPWIYYCDHNGEIITFRVARINSSRIEVVTEKVQHDDSIIIPFNRTINIEI